MKRQPRQCLKSERGCFGKEEEPHSSLLCLFVLLLVVHALVFPLPLLSVCGASLQMGNTVVVQTTKMASTKLFLSHQNSNTSVIPLFSSHNHFCFGVFCLIVFEIFSFFSIVSICTCVSFPLFFFVFHFLLNN